MIDTEDGGLGLSGRSKQCKQHNYDFVIIIHSSLQMFKVWRRDKN